MKSKIKINVIDIIIILLILAVTIAFSVNFLSGKSKFDFSKKSVVEVTLKIGRIPSSHANLITNNNKVYLSENDFLFGVVKSVNYTKSIKSDSGIYFYPDLTDAKIVIECNADVDKNTFIIGSRTYKVGDSIDFYVTGYSATGTVYDIEVTE